MEENYVVVIVTHNRLELLKECLTHVEAQTTAAMQIIVVDNASEDGTAQFLREKANHCGYHRGKGADQSGSLGLSSVDFPDRVSAHAWHDAAGICVHSIF